MLVQDQYYFICIFWLCVWVYFHSLNTQTWNQGYSNAPLKQSRRGQTLWVSEVGFGPKKLLLAKPSTEVEN